MPLSYFGAAQYQYSTFTVQCSPRGTLTTGFGSTVTERLIDRDAMTLMR